MRENKHPGTDAPPTPLTTAQVLSLLPLLVYKSTTTDAGGVPHPPQPQPPLSQKKKADAAADAAAGAASW